jgi:hypothetical protein
MSKTVHVLEKAGLMKLIEGNIHDSGYWKVSPTVAESLIGGDIYFHKKQKEASYFGGKILSYRVHEEEDEHRGRIIFRFESSREHRNVLSGDGGWSNAMKII